MKDKWEKVEVEVFENGEKTLVYKNAKYPGVKLESRKRAIPYVKCAGHWMHTSYFVCKDGSEKEYSQMRDAKAAIEGMYKED